jgi:hypothetical protein
MDMSLGVVVGWISGKFDLMEFGFFYGLCCAFSEELMDGWNGKESLALALDEIVLFKTNVTCINYMYDQLVPLT